MVAVFEGDEAARDWVERAAKGAAELEGKQTAEERWAPARAALKRAAALRDQGKRPEAERIWDGIEDLYRDDRFGIITPRELLAHWQARAPVDLRPLFRQYLDYDWIDGLTRSAECGMRNKTRDVG